MSKIEEMAEILKLLGDKTRLTIMGLLKEQELCVCEIVEILGMSQPSISQHLRKLKALGLVRESRRGQWVFYELAIEDKPFVQQTLQHLPCLKEKIIELEKDGLKISCQ